MIPPTTADVDLVQRMRAVLPGDVEAVGRSEAGELGGAVFVRRDGEDAVLTLFPGPLSDARALAATVNALRARGLPVARHDVVDVDGAVLLVQERLSAAAGRALSTRRVEEIVRVNDLFAGQAAGLADLPPLVSWFRPGGRDAADILADLPAVAQPAADRIAELVDGSDGLLDGGDVVHVDLTAANVLFDDRDRATGVVDWSLGAFRGERDLALVQTRFDREWFVRRADADDVETAAARRLDEILGERIAPGALPVLWAYWFLHQLPRAAAMRDSSILAWQLDFAAERLG